MIGFVKLYLDIGSTDLFPTDSRQKRKEIYIMALTQEDLNALTSLLDSRLQPIKDDIVDIKAELQLVKDDVAGI